MDNERVVSIIIKGKNLSGAEIAAAVQGLSGLKSEIDSVSVKSSKLKSDYEQLQDRLRKTAEASNAFTDSLAKQYGGGQVIQKANQYADAVTRVGGVTKLTKTEQAELNNVVTAAIEKYRVLGMQAPAHILSLQNATKGAKSEMTGMLGSITSVAAGFGLAFSAQSVVQGVVSFGQHIFDTADKIKDMAARMGVGIERAQQFGTAARQTGTDVETVTGAIGAMNNNLANPSDAAILMLRNVGLEVGNLRRMKPEDAFLAVTDAAKTIPNAMDQARFASELFGEKVGQKLLPGIREGFRGLADGADKMSKETVEALADAKQAWEDFYNDLTIKSAKFITDGMAAASGFAKLWGDVKATASGGLQGHRDYMASLAQQSAADQAKNAPGATPSSGPPVKTQAELKAIEDQKKAALDAAKKLKEAQDQMFGLDTIAKAKAYAVSLGDVANVTKLSRDKQKELNNVVEDALGVYRRMGIEAPANLMRIRQVLSPMVGETAAVWAKLNTLDVSKMAATLGTAPVLHDNFKADPTTQALDLRFSTLATRRLNEKFIPNLGLPGATPFTTLAPPPPKSFAQAAFGMTSTEFGSGLGKTITGAVMGGGNVGEAAGSFVGQQLGANIAKQSGKALEGIFGKTVGGAITAAIPGIGALLGPLAGKLVGKVVSLFTGGEGGKSNDLRDQLKAKFGDAAGEGLQAAVDKMRNAPGLADAYDRFLHAGNQKDVQKAFDDVQKSMTAAQSTLDKYGLSMDDAQTPQERLASSTKGLSKEIATLTGLGISNAKMSKGMATELNGVIRAALDAKGKLPAMFGPLLDDLAKGGLLADDLRDRLLGVATRTKVPWQDMKAAADEFGLTEQQLGDGFRNSQLIDNSQTLADKWHLLVDNGADVGATIDKMKGKAQEALTNFLQWGVEVPDSMKPMFEAMQKAGVLVDENGDKLDDLSRVKFSGNQLEPLTAALRDLVDTLRGDLPSAINDLRRDAGQRITIPVEVRQTRQWVDGDGNDQGGDQTTDTQYASGGIAEGRQVATIAERGRREIVGSEQFMTNALVGAIQRIGPSPMSTTQPAAAESTGPTIVQLVIDKDVLGSATLAAQQLHMRRNAAARVQYRTELSV